MLFSPMMLLLCCSPGTTTSGQVSRGTRRLLKYLTSTDAVLAKKTTQHRELTVTADSRVTHKHTYSTSTPAHVARTHTRTSTLRGYTHGQDATTRRLHSETTAITTSIAIYRGERCHFRT